MTAEAFDDVVIGGGQAGPSLAVRLAGAGRRVAIVERRHLGGTCINTGCRPTKALIASAKVAAMARRAADYGIAAGPVQRRHAGGDGARRRHRRRGAQGPGRLAAGDRGAHGRSPGHARLTGPREVAVGDRRLAAERIFLNVGARAAVPDLPGVREVPTLTNSSLLALDVLPEHLVVVGGGYIGLEFAQAYRRLGAAVTVVEKGPRLIGREDPDVSEAIRGILEAEGVRVRTRAECIRFAPHARGDRGRRRLRHRRAGGDREPRAPGDGPAAQHRRPRARGGGRRHRPAGLRHRRRPAGDQRSRHLGARRVQRPRRLHPHRLQRLRDRGGEPARRRRPQGHRPAARLRPLHRPAARPLRHDRGRGGGLRPAGPRRQAADDPGEPRGREGRDRGLHQGASPTPTAAPSSGRRSSASRATRRSTPSST